MSKICPNTKGNVIFLHTMSLFQKGLINAKIRPPISCFAFMQMQKCTKMHKVAKIGLRKCTLRNRTPALRAFTGPVTQRWFSRKVDLAISRSCSISRSKFNVSDSPHQTKPKQNPRNELHQTKIHKTNSANLLPKSASKKELSSEAAIAS